MFPPIKGYEDDDDDDRFVNLVAASRSSESVHDENQARDDHPRFNDNVGYDVERLRL